MRQKPDSYLKKVLAEGTTWTDEQLAVLKQISDLFDEGDSLYLQGLQLLDRGDKEQGWKLKAQGDEKYEEASRLHFASMRQWYGYYPKPKDGLVS